MDYNPIPIDRNDYIKVDTPACTLKLGISSKLVTCQNLANIECAVILGSCIILSLLMQYTPKFCHSLDFLVYIINDYHAIFLNWISLL